MTYPNKIRNERHFNELINEMSGGLSRSWDYINRFYRSIKRRNKVVQISALKQIDKILNNPNIGKLMRGKRKHQREVYVADSFRLYYRVTGKGVIIFLEFSHKDEQIDYRNYDYLFKEDSTDDSQVNSKKNSGKNHKKSKKSSKRKQKRKR